MKNQAKNRQQEGGSLSRAGLGACHEVPGIQDYRNGMFLHRGGLVILGQLHVGRKTQQDGHLFKGTK